MNNIAGIDPGKTGGIVLITDKEIKYWCIPKIGKEVDLRKLNDIFKLLPKDCTVFLERVHAIFGSAAGSTFTFGQVFGFLEAMIVAHELSYSMVDPKQWQKEMFMGINPIYKPNKKRKMLETKQMAELAYKRLFPELDLYITDNGNKSKKVHDGIVDALLIAEFGRRKIK
jgi:hypothetical protein